MLALFTVLNLLNYLDRFLLASVLPLVKGELDLSGTEGGILLGAFIVGYAGASPFVGGLEKGSARRRRAVLVMGVVVWSLATIVTGLVDSLFSMMLARIAVGIGEACFVTMSVSELRERYVDSSRLTKAFSIFYTAIPVGAALGYVVGGAVSEYAGWRSAFYVGGAPGLVLAFVLLCIRNGPEDAKPTREGGAPGWREVLQSRMFRIATFGYVLQTYALTGISSYVTSYAARLGESPEGVSQVFGGILISTGILGTVVGGRVAARRAAHSAHPQAELLRLTALWTVLGCPFIAAAFLTGTPWLFYSCTFIAELVIFAGTAPLNVVIVQSVAPGLVARAQGISIFAINIGGYLTSSILIGAVADWSHSLPLALQTTTVALLAAACIWGWGAWTGKAERDDEC